MDNKEHYKKYKDKQKEYLKRPEVIARRREYYRKYNEEYLKKQEVKKRRQEYAKEYSKRDYVKDKQKAYRDRPDVKARLQKRISTPEAKAKKALYDKQRYLKRKNDQD